MAISKRMWNFEQSIKKVNSRPKWIINRRSDSDEYDVEVGIANRHYRNVARNLLWICKYCGDNETPRCPQCVREDGKLVID